MPYPFTKGVFICGEPLYIRADAGPEEMEESRLRLENTLNGITARADGYFSRQPGRI